MAETPSQTLHRLTSIAEYDEATIWGPPVDDPRVAKGFEPNDLERLPWFYKRYDERLPSLPLPRDLPRTSAPAVGVLAGTAEVTAAPLELGQLARILYLSAGIVRTTERSFRTWLFRAAGSAGGRFPLELYVAVPEGTTLPAGVHWYHPQEHAMVRIGPPPAGGVPAVVITGVPWRTGWRYRERGFRHIYWDAGTMLSHLIALADSGGVDARLLVRFPDAAVAELVGVDRVEEWPLAVVALGEGSPATEVTGPATSGTVDRAPIEFPLETAAQWAGDLDALGAPWDRGAPVEVPLRGGRPVEDVIRSRGSIRLLDPTRGVSADLVRTSMLAAMRGIDIPHFVVVHDVSGLDPGLYRWPDLSEPRSRGDLRPRVYRVAMDQVLAQDAAFVVIGAVDVGSLDDRGYREAQLAAGLVEGRLHLLAYALGAAASGMTFVDDEIPGLLGEPLDGLLLTCVGVPEYRSAKAGPPGAPTRIRMVTPRGE